MASRMVRSNGIRQFIASLTDGNEVKAEVNRAANQVRNFARQFIRSGSRTGEVYPERGKDRKWVEGSSHVASAPGEPPASMTGTLASRIRVRPAKGRGTRKTAFVIPYAPHAHLLEFGTVRMAPRPFLGPAVENTRHDFQRGITAAMRREIAKAEREARRMNRKLK